MDDKQAEYDGPSSDGQKEMASGFQILYDGIEVHPHEGVREDQQNRQMHQPLILDVIVVPPLVRQEERRHRYHLETIEQVPEPRSA